jgi:hypothetical protein
MEYQVFLCEMYAYVTELMEDAMEKVARMQINLVVDLSATSSSCQRYQRINVRAY